MRRGPERRAAAWMLAPVLVLVLLTAAACSGNEGNATNGADGPGTTIANDDAGSLDYPAYSDPNTPIFIGLGRRFALKLQSEPSAGYSWQVANKFNPAVLTPLGTQLRSESPGIPGAPAQQYISFAANGVGSTTIEVHYVSPDGHTSTDPAPMTFNVTVTFDGQPPPPPPPDRARPCPCADSQSCWTGPLLGPEPSRRVATARISARCVAKPSRRRSSSHRYTCPLA